MDENYTRSSYVTITSEDGNSILFAANNSRLSINHVQRYIPNTDGLTFTSDGTEYLVPIHNGDFLLPPTIELYKAFHKDESTIELDDLIRKYFYTRLTYKEIIAVLSADYKINMSLITFKRHIKRLGLRRKNIIENPLVEIITIIELELEGSGKLLGYRSIWQRVRKYNHVDVKQETVRELLKIMDPDGVEERSRSKLKRRVYIVEGPNGTWHMDGYDKLKRWGFAIHGCADGFSKKIIWLRVSRSNNKPQIVLHYFLDAIQELGLIPTILRADGGSENGLTGEAFVALRSLHDDESAGHKSFHTGPSTANERIEKYWLQLRNHTCEYYIQVFKRMQDLNLIDNGNPFHVEFLRYCFGPQIEYDLKRAMDEWNEHRIRHQNLVKLPAGIPNVLFKCPEMFDAHDCKKSVLQSDIDVLYQVAEEPFLVDPLVQEIVDIVRPGAQIPCDTRSAIDLFLALTTYVDNL
ncbi:hypothetical protein QAD02_006356 [Eretmocerus hayati]|uniref:Uncharacterized protein n=1 Tax=Eretmocerus hayati TaxID=131215 RepID=A0ACC2N0Z5_9HYME|nr:hypothetical protein QAD02_006356 [Eretmocerus hayati]